MDVTEGLQKTQDEFRKSIYALGTRSEICLLQGKVDPSPMKRQLKEFYFLTTMFLFIF